MARHPQRALIAPATIATTAEVCRDLQRALSTNATRSSLARPRFRWGDFFDDLDQPGADEPRPLLLQGRRALVGPQHDRIDVEERDPTIRTLGIVALTTVAALILFGSLVWMPDTRAPWAVSEMTDVKAAARYADRRLLSGMLEEPSRLALFSPTDMLMSPAAAEPKTVGATAAPAETAIVPGIINGTATPAEPRASDADALEPAEPTAPPVIAPKTQAPSKPAARAADAPSRERGKRRTPPVVAQPKKAATSEPRTEVANQELKVPSLLFPFTMLLGGPADQAPAFQQ